MLPVVNKIQNDQLILQDYQLQEGQLKGMAQAMI